MTIAGQNTHTHHLVITEACYGVSEPVSEGEEPAADPDDDGDILECLQVADIDITITVVSHRLVGDSPPSTESHCSSKQLDHDALFIRLYRLRFSI